MATALRVHAVMAVSRRGYEDEHDSPDSHHWETAVVPGNATGCLLGFMHMPCTGSPGLIHTAQMRW